MPSSPTPARTLGEAVEKASDEVSNERLHHKLQVIYLDGSAAGLTVAAQTTDVILRSRLDPRAGGRLRPGRGAFEHAHRRAGEAGGREGRGGKASPGIEAGQGSEAGRGIEAGCGPRKGQPAEGGNQGSPPTENPPAQAAPPARVGRRRCRRPRRPSRGSRLTAARPPRWAWPPKSRPRATSLARPASRKRPRAAGGPVEQLLARLRTLPRDEPPNDRLEVSYIVASDPGVRHNGTVLEIHRSAEVSGDEGNTVLIKVKIDKSELLSPSPGHRRDGESRLRPPRTRVRPAARRDRIHPVEGPVPVFLIGFLQSKVLFRHF